MILLPYLLSLTLGILLLTVIARGRLQLNLLLFYSLAFGLGLGASAVLSFFSFLAVGQFAPKVLIGVHAVVLIGLFFFAWPVFPWKKQLAALCASWPWLLCLIPLFPLG